MNWRVLILPFILTTLTFESFATHIVGGEIELVHGTGFEYTVNLILYFDDVNGNPQAEDQFVTIGFFRKTDNFFVDSISLPRLSSAFVPYSFPDCSIPQLRTRRIIYSAKVTLSPGEYNDPGGYYISWDRCCRNDNISNLLLPGTQGQLFYLEFPPVFRNGSQFINSSPVLFPPVSDYACRNELFYFDFGGTDPDNDSLVYSLANPLRGISSTTTPIFPVPFPGPYPEVIWQTGINVNNMIPGTPPLRIDNDGFLTVRPQFNGLYVFSVKCEEYRDGIKIGEIRRDFQIIVTDCPSNDSPQISVQNPQDSSNYSGNDTLFFDTENRCFDIYLKDPDPNTQFDVEINALNFDPRDVNINPANGVIPSGDSLRARICFNKCARSDTAAYKFEIILSDDGCSLPKKDTFLVTAIVEDITDQSPTISSNLLGDSIILEVGDTLIMNVFGFDTDDDSVVLSYGSMLFNPLTYGMDFTRTIGQGSVVSQFTWVPQCDALDIDGLYLVFTASDFLCSRLNSDLFYPLKITSDNLPPVISSNQSQNLETNIRDGVNIDLISEDPNKNDRMTISLEVTDSTGILLQNLGYTFSETFGFRNFTSEFNWQPDCDLIDFSPFYLNFTLRDNACAEEMDTALFIVDLKYENLKPRIEFESGSESGKSNLSLLLYTDSLIDLNLTGIDDDNDNISFRWEWIGGESIIPIQSNLGEGPGTALADFQLGPGICIPEDVSTDELLIILEEESCEDLRDSLIVAVIQEDILKEVEMPNIFTPNNDGFNDFFQSIQLPKKCSFSEIKIYNRWGREVYASSDPDFKWDGANLPSGEYFYLIKIEGKSYKGNVRILR